MINETYFNKKYNTFMSTNVDDYSLIDITVHDNNANTMFVGVVNAYPDDFALYPLIQKCMLRESHHVVSYIRVNPRQLNLHFIAHLGGFVKIDFEVPLFDKDAPINYEHMISRLVPVTSLLNPDVDNYIQSGYICVEKDRMYMPSSTKKLLINQDMAQSKIMWENIQGFHMLESLKIDSAVVNLSTMANDSVRHIILVKSTLLSLDGIRGFPGLTVLTLEGCEIPCDFVDVLRANMHKITTIELIQCEALNNDMITDNGMLRNNGVLYNNIIVNIKDYCETSGIAFIY
jgi:hypothetical protein